MKCLNDKIRIIIADDSSEFIEGLKLLFSISPEFEIIDICNNGLELVESKKLYKADVLLIDIDMPILNGLEAAKRIDFKHPHIPKIAITMYQGSLYLNEIISTGFKGFVSKPDATHLLIETIKSVLVNNFIFPENLKIG